MILLGLVFIVAGVMHFVAPASYAQIIPTWLPNAPLLVTVSGVAEILGGVGVLLPSTRRAAGWGLIALLVAVFPANVQMLLMAHRNGASMLWQAVLVARLPFQWLLIRWVYALAVRTPSSPPLEPVATR